MSRIVAIYARQSLFKQDSVSIETQIEQCRGFAKDRTIEIYHDKGWSGKNVQRPEMQRLISNIKEGKIETVISYRLDRISRNIVDFGRLLELFEKNDVEYISATENLETKSPMGRAMLYIVATFAALERETIALRIADNYKYRASKGTSFMGGNVPFGYRSERVTIDGKRISVLKIDEENVPLLKRIFTMYTSNDSIFSIVKTLNQEGLRTSKGNPFTANGIKRILSNITPCEADERLYEFLQTNGYNVTNSLEEFTGDNGMLLFLKNKDKNKETSIENQICIIGIHQPLISSEKWIKSQLVLQGNKGKVSSKRSQRTYLAGLIRCKCCGYSFGVKTTTKGEKSYGYYYCRGRGNRGICDNLLYMKCADLEKEVIEGCMRYLNEQRFERELYIDKDIIDESVSIQKQIDNIITNIGKGNSVVDELLTNKISELNCKLNEFKRKKNNSKYEENELLKINQLNYEILTFDELSIEDKTTLIRRLVDYVTVDENRIINIHYKI